MKEDGKRITAGKWKRMARQKGKEREEGSMTNTDSLTTSGQRLRLTSCKNFGMIKGRKDKIRKL